MMYGNRKKTPEEIRHDNTVGALRKMREYIEKNWEHIHEAELP